MFAWDNEELSVDTAHDLLENDWYTEEDLYQRSVQNCVGFFILLDNKMPSLTNQM